MKRNITILLVFFVVQISYSQFVCGENQEDIMNKFDFQQNPSLVQDDPSVKHVFNVRFHVVYNDDGITRDNNGVAGLDIGFEECMNAIRDYNIAFNPFNIYFKYYGFDQVNETQYMTIDTNQEYSDIVNSTYSVPDAINIYIINGSVIGACARVHVLDDDCFIEPWTICHEMGHKFLLAHPNYIGNTTCEHNERDYTEPGFNADVTGDQVVDTHCYTPVQFYNSNCDYIGGYADCQNTPIVANTTHEGTMIYPTFQNYMYSYNSNILSGLGVTCPLIPVFTTGQGTRMREAIIGFWASEYDTYRNTVQSLYQPFETINIPGSVIVSTQDLGNGTAKVCRNILEKHRFQKGFEYVFPDNLTPDPLTAGVNDLPEDINHTYNYRVIINQVNPLVEEVVEVICTRGVICNIETIVGGKDLITDFIGSYNFTIEEWDKLKVNDPNLYDQLEGGKYHVIRKETESGGVIEVTLYKF